MESYRSATAVSFELSPGPLCQFTSVNVLSALYQQENGMPQRLILSVTEFSITNSGNVSVVRLTV
jgi:hypothetical protein